MKNASYFSILTQAKKSMVFCSFAITLCAREPIVVPAAHTQQPINAIRNIFYQIPSVNAQRSDLGLDPVINLSIGQPHIPMQMKALDAFIQYLQELKKFSPEELCTEMGYSDSAGLLETRQWISRFFTESFPKVLEGFAPEEVMITNGATGALTNALRVLIQEGDEVLTLAPHFAGYANQVRSCRGCLIPIPFLPNRSSAELLEEYLSLHPKAKVLIWNDPNNPLGTKADKEELQKLAATIKKYPNLIVIHDEVYKDIVHDGSSLSLLDVAPEIKSRSFIIRSLAKDILGAPAIRAGMIAAPVNMQTPTGHRVNFIELMSNEQLRDITGISILVQRMLVIALQQKLSGVSKSWEESMRKEYANNTKFVFIACKKLGLRPLAIPRGAFYIMIDASTLIGKKIPEKIGHIQQLNNKMNSTIQNDLDVANFFLHAAGVAVVPSSGFGMHRHGFRISCAKPRDQLVKAMERIQQAVGSLLD